MHTVRDSRGVTASRIASNSALEVQFPPESPHLFPEGRRPPPRVVELLDAQYRY